MASLEGKVAIVTGGARGIGRGFARRLARLGAKVAIFDIDLQSWREFEGEARGMTASSTVAEIEAEGGVAMGIEVDTTDPEAVKAAVEQVAQSWGRIDILRANAGGGSVRSRNEGERPYPRTVVITARTFSGQFILPPPSPVHKAAAVRQDHHDRLLAAIGTSYNGAMPIMRRPRRVSRNIPATCGDLGPSVSPPTASRPASPRPAVSPPRLGETPRQPSTRDHRLRRFGTVEDCANARVCHIVSTMSPA